MTSVLVEHCFARTFCSRPRIARPLAATTPLLVSRSNFSSNLKRTGVMTAKRPLSASSKSDSPELNNKQAKMSDDKAENGGSGAEAHQYQAGSTTHREEDQWKFRSPYRIREDNEKFDAKWKGKCHCGRIEYQLSREKPLASKYCHCTTCQRLHGAPFQWAAIFHKEDINFTHGHHDLGWYDPSAKSTTHHLPCKVQCAYCRTPIMDEGRNMILLFPTLIEGINTKKGREAFAVQSHMFYPQRVVDFKGDGVKKFKGLADESPLVDDDGNEIEGSG